MLDVQTPDSPELYRSIHPEFVPLIIREYEHWTLLVSDNQNYPGRMVIWLLRPGNMQRFSELTPDEAVELTKVCRHAEFSLAHLFKPAHINYEWQGNLFHLHGGHGHMHLIPRYTFPIRYRGKQYFDTRWGRHPHVDNNKYLPPQVELIALRDDLKQMMLK
jgi:diadenosine tetraphosphate (Ap4A) HIT family hydrolase